MRLKNIWAACTALVLATGMALAVPLGASAEDAPATDSITQTDTTQQETPAELPIVEDTAPEVAVEVDQPEATVEAPASAEPMNVTANSPPADKSGKDHKVTICHAVNGKGQMKNGFNVNTVDTNSITKKNGHDSHKGDVIPAFDNYPGKNLTTEYEWGFTGQQLLDNGCASPVKPEPQPEPEPVVNDCVSGINTHSTQLNDLWNNIDTRADGNVEYVEGGLHIWTTSNGSQAKVNEGMAVNFPLHDTGIIDIDWEGTTPAPGVNLYVNFGADGNGTLVYEEVYGQDLWLTNGSSAAVKANAPVNGGGNGSQWHGTIDQWLTKYPEATVTGIAYSLGSGVLGDGVIKSISVGCAMHTFDYVAPPTFEPTCLTADDTMVIEGDGKFEVAGDWATDEIAVPFSGTTLADIGAVLNIDADPLAFVGLHIDTAEGTIVFEEEASYAGKLWSNVAWTGVSAGMGYAAFGTIQEFIHLNGDVAVTGIRLLYTSPVASSTTVTSFTIGCTVYTFEPKAGEPQEPTEEPVTPEEPTKEEPKPVVPTADVLPRTGSESGAWLMFAGALLALGLVGTASRALIRRK